MPRTGCSEVAGARSGLAGAGGGELAGCRRDPQLSLTGSAAALAQKGAPTAGGTTTTPPLSALPLTRPRDLTSATL